jgi:hypothetical protein
MESLSKKCIPITKNNLINKILLFFFYFFLTFSSNVSATQPDFSPYINIPVGSNPEGAAIGDINNDGRNDVVMTTGSGSDVENDYHLFVFLQQADGSLGVPVKYLTSGTFSDIPESVDIGDINGDGLNDVVVGNEGQNIDVFLQNASGNLDSPIVIPASNADKIRVGDLNNDNLDDVVGIGWDSDSVDVFLQDITGNLMLPDSYFFDYGNGGDNDLEIADINNDGLIDIIVMSGCCENDIGVFTQNLLGGFDPVIPYGLDTTENSNGLAVGDLNGDFLNDIIINQGGSGDPMIGVFSQNQLGQFEPLVLNTTYFNPKGMVVADINTDGLNDLVVLHYSGRVGVYPQNVNGELDEEILFNVPTNGVFNGHALDVGDINGDQSPDIVYADSIYGLVVLYNELNAPPNVTINSPADWIVSEPLLPITFTGTATDPDDGDISSLIDWQSDIDGAIGTGASLITTLSEGTHVITATVTASDTQTRNSVITVRVAQDPPVANDDSAVVDEAATVNINVAGNDSDINDGLDLGSINIITDPNRGSVTVNTNGTVDYTHDGSEATINDSFIYTISDLSGALSNRATVSVTLNPVNDLPIAEDDSATTILQGDSITVNVTANDSDADDGLDFGSIVILSGPNNGSYVVNSNGTIDYTHDGSLTTTDSLTYTINDLSGAISNIATVSFTMIRPNIPPVAVNDVATTYAVTPVVIDVLANDTDADGDSLTIESVSSANFGTTSTDGLTITYTPIEGYPYPVPGPDGLDTLVYTVIDGYGGSAFGIVNLTVLYPNEIPIATDNTATVNKGATINIDVAANDNDPDGNLDLGSIVIIDNPAYGSVLVNGDGTVSYMHDDSVTTADSFTYTINDNVGATSNIATVTLVINDVPVAGDDSTSLNEGSTININLASNDIDTVGGLNLNSITIVNPPVNGNVIVNGDGTVDYTHNGSETISDSFTYSINDSNGSTSNVATVNITINSVNDLPVALNDNAIVDEGAMININLASNDTDNDDGIDIDSINIINAPINGSVFVNADGTVDYTHDGSLTTSDSFTYTISDLSGAISNIATVNVNVIPLLVTFPLEFNFDSGLPGIVDGWDYYSSNTTYGRIEEQNGRMRMDVTTNGNYSLNEAILTVDLTGVSQVSLSFFQAEFGDENHATVSSFTDHLNADGVAISNDGISWYTIQNATALDVGASGQNFIVDLDAEVSRIQSDYDPTFNYSSDFKIKFQQYDNYAYPTDGREWDDIRIDAVHSSLNISPSSLLDISVNESDLGVVECQEYILENTGDDALNWATLINESWWLSISESSGFLIPGESNTVDVCWDTSSFSVGEEHNGQITFNDSLGGDEQIRLINIRVIPDSSVLPYTQDFTNGLPDISEGWEYYSSNATYGRITEIGGRMRMDVSSNGNYSLNEAVLSLDLSGQSNLQLTFFQAESGDERTTMPPTFTGHNNADGVAISADGIVWYRILTANDLDVGIGGQTFNIDLDAVVSSIQSTFDEDFAYGSDFKIKFQQYDNFTFGSDGRDWDNVSVTVVP